MIQQEEFDHNEYCWTANPIGVILALEESDDSTGEADEPSISSSEDDEEPVLMVRQLLPVDLTMEPVSFFRPYIKIIFNPLEESQVALTTLIDTGAVCSIIREACVPKDCYVPTQVSFGLASGEDFYNRKYTRRLKLNHSE